MMNRKIISFCPLLILAFLAAVIPRPSPVPGTPIYPNPDLTVDRADDLEAAYNSCNGVLTIPPGVYPVSRTVDFTKREANVRAEQATIQELRPMTAPLVVYGAPLGKRNLTRERWTGGTLIGGGGFVAQNLSYAVIDIGEIRCGSPAFTLRGDTAVGAYCVISLRHVYNNTGAIKLDQTGDGWSGFVTFRDTVIVGNRGNIALIVQTNKTTAHGLGDWLFDRCDLETASPPGDAMYTLFDVHAGLVTFRNCHMEGNWPKPCSFGNIGAATVTFERCSDNTGITGDPRVRVIR
jgi:hypothetical protein